MATTSKAGSSRDAVLRRLRQPLLSRSGAGSLMLGLGAAVGVATGSLAAALIAIIQLSQGIAWGSGATPLEVVLVPTVGAFVVGLLVTYWVPEASGSGVLRTMSVIALHGGRFRGRVPLSGVVASGVALGTGASGGREGPIVLIGGSVGSLLGRLFAIDEERMRTLIAAGAAAGIGASFNAPIGGMLFAIELIVGNFKARSLQVVVVASVIGSVTARELVGPGIIYAPAVQYQLGDVLQLVFYALLGLLAVTVGLGFIYGEDLAAKLTARLPLWRPLKLALAGLAVGLIALGVPEVLGTGESLPPIAGVREPIQFLLDGEFGVGWQAAGLMLLLAVAKLVATCLSVGSGNAVGTFAPAVFTGAALGGAFGAAADTIVPAVGIEPGAFALVGTAAAFAAVARAPLTAILIAFELTGDYGLVLPLMLSVGLATFIADRLQPESLYTFQLRKRGIVYAEPVDVDIMQTVTVGEIMSVAEHVPASLPRPALLERFRQSGRHGFAVSEGERLVGVVTISDVERCEASRRDDEATAGELCSRPPVTVTPDDPMFRAVRRMAALNVGRLPVVAGDDHSRLVGIVRRADVVEAYRRAVNRSLGVQQRGTSSRLRDLSGTQLVELVVDGRAAAAGRRIRDVSWPARTLLASIRRDGDVLTPRGDTELLAGDEVVVLTAREATEEVRSLLAGDTEVAGA